MLNKTFCINTCNLANHQNIMMLQPGPLALRLQKRRSLSNVILRMSMEINALQRFPNQGYWSNIYQKPRYMEIKWWLGLGNLDFAPRSWCMSVFRHDHDHHSLNLRASHMFVSLLCPRCRSNQYFVKSPFLSPSLEPADHLADILLIQPGRLRKHLKT